MPSSCHATQTAYENAHLEKTGIIGDIGNFVFSAENGSLQIPKSPFCQSVILHLTIFYRLIHVHIHGV